MFWALAPTWGPKGQGSRQRAWLLGGSSIPLDLVLDSIPSLAWNLLCVLQQDNSSLFSPSVKHGPSSLLP